MKELDIVLKALAEGLKVMAQGIDLVAGKIDEIASDDKVNKSAAAKPSRKAKKTGKKVVAPLKDKNGETPKKARQRPGSINSGHSGHRPKGRSGNQQHRTGPKNRLRP